MRDFIWIIVENHLFAVYHKVVRRKTRVFISVESLFKIITEELLKVTSSE